MTDPTLEPLGRCVRSRRTAPYVLGMRGARLIIARRSR